MEDSNDNDPRMPVTRRHVPWWGFVIAALVVVTGVFAMVSAAQNAGSEHEREVCKIMEANGLDC